MRLRKPSVLALALIALVSSLGVSGVAHAQDARASQRESTSAPWYERFTFGSSDAAARNGGVPRAQPRSDVRVSPRSRWGVSFGVQEDSSSAAVRNNAGRSGASAGAFYEVTPRVRVRGQVVVPNEAETEAWRRNQQPRRQPGLKVESAFRF